MSSGSPGSGGIHEYALTGPQVEYEASYWMYCSKLCIPSIDALTKVTDDSSSGNQQHYFPPYPDPNTPQGAAVIKAEMEELVELAHHRDDPCALVGAKSGKLGLREPISKLLNLTPPPLGAVLMNRFPAEQIIRTGRGMARAVEGETPGLYHRQALNYLIGTRHWSPPRQALIWAALDVAIASALQAAWYYKWLSPRPLTHRRERPIEYAKRHGIPLTVLFDLPDELNPAYNLCPDGRKPGTMSGTPRHPAYPSGHSTYTGAASELLAFFFGQQVTPEALLPHPELGSKPNTKIKTELDHLADNIGLGRMWAGIHWRTDHEAGMKLGRTVAGLIIQQLADMGLDDLCRDEPKPIKDQCDFSQTVACDMKKLVPPLSKVEQEAQQWKKNCGPKPKPSPCAAPPASTQQALDANRGVQRGAR